MKQSQPSGKLLFWILMWSVAIALFIFSCSSDRACQTADNCLWGEVCHSTKKICSPQCEGERCNIQSCEGGECDSFPDAPSGDGLSSLAKACERRKDCFGVAGEPVFCLRNGKDGAGRCVRLCRPQESGPSSGRCVCPPGTSWSQNACLPVCRANHRRREDGQCEPDLAALAAPYWRRNTKGKLEWLCPKGWVLDAKGTCQLTSLVLEPPTKPTWTSSISKPCSVSANQRWDEDYLKRAKLPSNHGALPLAKRVIYVDSAAASHGSGSSSAPFRRLSDALDAALDGSVLLLASGVYEWGKTISKSIHLVGLCTEKTRIEATFTDKHTGLSIRKGGVVVEGITLNGKGLVTQYGLYIRAPGASVVLRQVRIVEAGKVNVIGFAGNVEMDRCEVQKAVRSGSFGHGVYFGMPNGKVVIRKSWIHHNTGPGVALTGLSQATIRGSLIQNNGIDDSLSRGIAVQKVTGPLLFENNQILHNASAGLYVNKSKNVVVKNNLFQSNGLRIKVQSEQQFGRGLNLFEVGGVTLENNTIDGNGAHGVFLQVTGTVSMISNLVEKNGRLHKQGAGVEITSVTGEVVVESNTVRNNTRRGVFIDKISKGATVRMNVIEDIPSYGLYVGNTAQAHLHGNLVRRTGNDNPNSRGINLQDISGPLTFTQNHVVNNEGQGVFASNISQVSAKGNLIRGGLQVQKTTTCFHLKTISTVRVEHNQFVQCGGAGLLLKDVSKATILGNKISQNGSVRKDAHGLSVSHGEGKGELELRGNLIGQNASTGAYLSALRVIRASANIVRDNGVHQTDASGLFLSALQKQAVFDNNLVENNPLGLVLFGIPSQATVTFRNLTSFSNQSSGLVLLRNQGQISIFDSRFDRNGGAHIHILNQSGSLKVENNTFYRARESGAKDDLALPKSEGMGLFIGAVGLVRWVFAKASYPCSSTVTKGLTGLPQGWTARPIRLPYSLDPCQKWSYGHEFRTDGSRLEASPCQKCYKQGKGCRWIWRDVGVGNSFGTGVWSPLEGEQAIVCTKPSEYDTCKNPYSFAQSPLKPLERVFYVRGQCIQLDSSNNPCLAQDMRECRKKEETKTGYCLLQSVEPNDSVSAYCTDWKGKDERVGVCQPDVLKTFPCPKGTNVCLDTKRIVAPLNPFPSLVQATNNIFWANLGPDVFFDSAGQVTMQNNLYLYCNPNLPNTSCTKKIVHLSVLSPNPKKPRTWNRETLPSSATIVWQSPSPFGKGNFPSFYLGNDFSLQQDRFSILYTPSFCEEVR